MNKTISVAPMMDCTDRHDRFFLRLMSKNVMLYTEMVATKSAIHGDRDKILGFRQEEKPLALQVGGSDKKDLAEGSNNLRNLKDSVQIANNISANLNIQIFEKQELLTVVSPDVGGVARARGLAERISADLAIVDKRRNQPGEIASMTVIGEVKNKICIIVDDICDTAGTLVKASDLLINKGAREVHAYISHGVLSDPAIERIEKSSLSSLVVTDSISIISKIKNSTKIRIVPTAPLFAQALLNIANGNSVSSLFDSERLRPIYKPYYPKYHIEKKRKA